MRPEENPVMSDTTPEISFRAMLQLHGKTATGLEVPPELVERLGAGKKPAVRVTIGGHTYRSTIAARGARFLVGVSSENRAAAGVAAGDELDVTLALDTAPREVEVPDDLAAALDAAPDARRFFEGMTYSDRRAQVMSIEGAKTPETRQRRIDRAVERFLEGKAR
jgi:Bacteriocin-protection, YdeI or OmpD-Associated/Domain of unknown function (DUF1905)